MIEISECLKDKSVTDNLPSMKALKEEMVKLTQLKSSQYTTFQNLREYKKAGTFGTLLVGMSTLSRR